MTRLLAIVPARAGSKGVPGKNKAPIKGRPLIDYTVAALRKADCVDGILITTDDEDILAFYEGQGDIMLVRRPPELATDKATTVAAVKHALAAWEASGNTRPEAIFLAQPTTPLRTVADIEAAYKLFLEDGATSLISCCRVDGMRHPRDMYRRADSGHGELFISDPLDSTTRHDYEELYQRNGAIYIVSLAYFESEDRLRAFTPMIYEMPWERSINIDGPGDMLIAKSLIESGLVGTE
jgi:CMP-N-acetylneuraminic acid synthetase